MKRVSVIAAIALLLLCGSLVYWLYGSSQCCVEGKLCQCDSQTYWCGQDNAPSGCQPCSQVCPGSVKAT